jgi:hypothetical protein
MLLEAFVLPLPGKSLGVVFWDRPRRVPGQPGTASGVAVYAPGEVSEGEVAELRAALVASVGDALQAQVPAPRTFLIAWWVLGAVSSLLFGLQVVQYDLGLGLLALVAMAATLPWGTAGATFRTARTAIIARRMMRVVGDLPAVPASDARAAERVTSLWQLARRQKGSEQDLLRALEQHCREQGWPAAARVYADLLAGPGTASPPGRLRLGRRQAAAGAPLYAATEMRAWA